MELSIPITIEVDSVDEIKPVSNVRSGSTLSIKTTMSKQQVARFILNALDDLTIKEINDAIKMEGFNIELSDFIVNGK